MVSVFPFEYVFCYLVSCCFHFLVGVGMGVSVKFQCVVIMLFVFLLALIVYWLLTWDTTGCIMLSISVVDRRLIGG